MDMRWSGRMLDAVKATPEQRAQIQKIMEGARTDLQAQREAGKALRGQLMQTMAQPTIDANAVEQVRQKMLAQHDQASKRRLQAMVDAAKVLTPEQRKQLAERMSQRRDMMERHHRERRALEARALMNLGRYDHALEVLGTDASPEARAVKAEHDTTAGDAELADVAKAVTALVSKAPAYPRG